MTDLLLSPLIQQLNQSKDHKILWVVDENIDDDTISQVDSHAQLFAISNRYDRYLALTQADIQTNFSDFDFSIFSDDSFDHVCFRVCKERAVTHFVLNQLHRILKSGGQLLLCGMKNDGFKSYLDKARQLFNDRAEQINLGKTAYMAQLCKQLPEGDRLDDKNYTQLDPIIPWQQDYLYSKPGVFGWDKIDQGSAFLVETMQPWLAQHATDGTIQNVLDLGCGYGYLCVALAQHLAANYVATDNNAAAVIACRKNFDHFNLSGRVVSDHCAAQVKPAFELVVCNPPFHAGFAVESNLTLQFLLAAKRLMRNNGNAFFVVNAFIGIEKIAAQHFRQITTLANNKRFKVIQLQP